MGLGDPKSTICFGAAPLSKYYYWSHLLRIVLTRTSQGSVYLYTIYAGNIECIVLHCIHLSPSLALPPSSSLDLSLSLSASLFILLSPFLASDFRSPFIMSLAVSQFSLAHPFALNICITIESLSRKNDNHT